jgi:hypothetical protein
MSTEMLSEILLPCIAIGILAGIFAVFYSNMLQSSSFKDTLKNWVEKPISKFKKVIAYPLGYSMYYPTMIIAFMLFLLYFNVFSNVYFIDEARPVVYGSGFYSEPIGYGDYYTVFYWNKIIVSIIGLLLAIAISNIIVSFAIKKKNQ